MQEKKLPITRENLTISILCGAVLIIFVLLWLLPALREYRQSMAELPQARTKMREIRQVTELSSGLDKKLASLQQVDGVTRPLPLPVDDAPGFIEQLTTTAARIGLEKRRLSLEVQTGGPGRQLLKVSSTFSGTARHCRLFVHQLLQEPHVREIVGMHFTAADQDVVLDLEFTIELI